MRDFIPSLEVYSNYTLPILWVYSLLFACFLIENGYLCSGECRNNCELYFN